VIRLLGLCGSLRQASLHAAMLRVIRRVAPANIDITLYDGMAKLPLFNPDLESSSPLEVETLRSRLNAADGIIIASPEYAHGISGVMKNALDWMVGNETFVDKPVMLVNASARASYAPAALREVLVTMSARVIGEATLTVPLLGSGLDEMSLQAHPDHVQAMRVALARLVDSIRSAERRW